MSFLTNKKVLIVGVLNQRSIAYGIAEAMHKQGAKLAFTYQNEKLKDRIVEIAKNFNTNLVLPCDVSSDEEINQVFVNLAKSWNKLDIVVHSVAYAPTEELSGDYLTSVTRNGFKIAHEISSYSLTALAKAAQPMMQSGGALLTISYLGAERAVPSYNVMGIAKASLEASVRYLALSLGSQNIRVNAISAGPIKTVSASVVKDIRKMLLQGEKLNPLKRNVTIEEVGNAAAFLCSDLASGITGEILYVDAGFNIVGMPNDLE